MEDILASIRRLLKEEEVPAVPAQRDIEPGKTSGTQAGEAKAGAEDILLLDNSMMVASDMPERDKTAPEPEAAPPGLVASTATEEVASSVSALVRTLANDRAAQVRSTGPTLEDLVREEMRPLLKAWLDQNLPPLVERLVRAEIDRVVARAH